MENFERFDVVLVPFPFTDRATSKRRPALLLSGEDFFKDSGQVICAMITTAKRSHWESDINLEDWSGAGLPAPSKVRMKIFTLDSRMILRKLGKLSKSDARLVKRSSEAVFT